VLWAGERGMSVDPEPRKFAVLAARFIWSGPAAFMRFAIGTAYGSVSFQMGESGATFTWPGRAVHRTRCDRKAGHGEASCSRPKS